MSFYTNKTTLSILITFYNQDTFIERTIKSCLKSFGSSSFSYKILVCLQAPSTKAIEIIENYVKDYQNISYITNTPEKNLIPLSKASLNRYELLQIANSKYCLFLDGDDAYLTNVDDGIAALESDDTLAGCGYAYALYHWTSKSIEELTLKYSNGEIITAKNNQSYMPANCIVFRRKILLNSIPNIYYNDTTITRALLHSGKNIKFFSRCLMLYSVGIHSIYSGATSAEKKLSEFIINEESIKIFPDERRIFLKRMKNLTRCKGYEQIKNMDTCWKDQIDNRNLFFSKLFLYSLVAPSVSSRILSRAILRSLIFAKRITNWIYS